MLAAGLLFIFGAVALPAATNISNSPNWQSWYPRVAVDPEGNVHAAWAEVYGSGSGDCFYARLSKATGQWSAPVNLSDSGRVWSDTLMLCSIDADDAGNVHVIWAAQSAVMVRTRTSAGWSSITQIGSGSALDGPRIAATGGGDLFCVWWDGGGSIIVRARVGGSWESTQLVSEGGRRSKFPDIGVGSAEALACWVEKSGDIYQAAYATRGTSFGAGWSAGRRAAPSSNSQQHPVVEYAGGATPHIIFTPVIDPDRIVQHIAWTGGGFGSPVNISDTTMLHYPSLAEKAGTLFAVWQVGSFGSGQAVYQNVYQAGKWSGQSAIPASNGCTYCDVAVDVAGKANVVWDAGGEIYFSLGSSGGPSIPNQSPVADFVFSPATGIAPLTVGFDGGGSYDPDGRIVQHDWIFDDGDTASGQTTTHTFIRQGQYAVKLTVVDNLGKSGSKVRTIEILGLFSPLNVRWESHTDESLFLTRTVNEIAWEPNPRNDDIAAIVIYRVYRKKIDEDDAVYKAVAETDGDTFVYRDSNVSGPGLYVYSVSALDAAGHESPLSGTATTAADDLDAAAKARIRKIFEGRGR